MIFPIYTFEIIQKSDISIMTHVLLDIYTLNNVYYCYNYMIICYMHLINNIY